VGASVWLKVDVSGMEHIDKQKTYIIVCNHQSMLDILFLYKIPLSFKWVSKREVYKIPLVGILVWLHRDVTVKRGDASSARKMISECSKWLQQGISMVIFAEGTRSKDGRVAEFKEGAFVVAKKNNIPILPVVIEGTRAFSNGNKWNLLNARQKVNIKVLPAIEKDEISSSSIRELAAKTHNIIKTEHNKIVLENQTNK
jgi:1-acyl-sn-glycerol-3-phosphate acyltransferase